MEASFEIFKKYLTQNNPVSENVWTTLEELLVYKTAAKETCIVKIHQLYQKEVFIVSGIVRLYYQGNEGEEINIAFHKGPDVLPPYFSRHIADKHSCFIETLTAVEYIEFDALEFSRLIREHNSIQKFAYNVVERELQFKIEREKLLLTQNAQKRLMAFRERYKSLENEIPHYHIASYLGISPVSLSRLRNQVK